MSNEYWDNDEPTPEEWEAHLSETQEDYDEEKRLRRREHEKEM